MTSSPDRVRSLGMRQFAFERYEQRRGGNEAQFRKVLPLQVQRYGLVKVRDDLIERVSLGYDGNFKAFRDIGLLPAADDRLNRVLELHSLSIAARLRDINAPLGVYPSTHALMHLRYRSREFKAGDRWYARKTLEPAREAACRVLPMRMVQCGFRSRCGRCATPLDSLPGNARSRKPHRCRGGPPPARKPSFPLGP